MRPSTATQVSRNGLGHAFLAAALLIHAALCLGAWWVLPHGFPVFHLRFWSNSFVPWALIVTSVCAAFSSRPLRLWLTGAIVACEATGVWVAVILFPISIRPAGVLGGGAGLVVAVLLIRDWRRLIAVGLGAAVALAQRSPEAATRPVESGEIRSPASEPRPASLTLGRTRVDIGSGRIVATNGRALITVDPLLTFHSLSPDRFWTLLAPAPRGRGQARVLQAFGKDGADTVLRYQDDGETVLRLMPAGPDGETRLAAETRLMTPLYSHLNSFTQITFANVHKLSLSFSPCPRPVEVKPSGYPHGLPLRFAYLDAGGIFHVVEASDAEKGPFRELASSPLARSEVLSITLLDEGHAFGRIDFQDWAAEASTQLSPAAGWGVPENAIEFSEEGSISSMFVSLAATSVGLGFDSVGHAAGVYRNRMTIALPEQLAPQ